MLVDRMWIHLLSVNKEPKVMAIDQPPELNLEDPNWRFPILEWLVEGKLPSDQTEARRIAR
jgi:hypothetical protein